MFSIANFLDSAKEKAGIGSDYQLSKMIRKKQSAIANYRSGRNMPDAQTLAAICDLSGDDAALIAAQIEAERAKNDSARALWLQVAARLMAAPRTMAGYAKTSSFCFGGHACLTRWG